MKTLLAIAFALCAFPAAANESFESALRAPAPQPGMHSFAELYRLTVSSAALTGLPPLAPDDSPVRVTAAAPLPEPQSQFSIAAVGEPRGWLLLSGLAAALWVARRRLGHAF